MNKILSWIFILIFIAPILSASVNISKLQIHNLTKDNKKMTCGYCHVKPLQLEKKKNNYLKGQINYKNLSKLSQCNGSGCH